MAWRRSVHGWFSRALVGSALGCSALLVAEVLIIFFGRPLYKNNHEGWERVFWVATFGLPAVLAVGAITGLLWKRSRPFRMEIGGLAGCCLAIALISKLLRPVVARARTAGPAPYEVIPDSIAAVFTLGALAIVVVGAIWRSQSPGVEDAAVKKTE